MAYQQWYWRHPGGIRQLLSSGQKRAYPEAISHLASQWLCFLMQAQVQLSKPGNARIHSTQSQQHKLPKAAVQQSCRSRLPVERSRHHICRPILRSLTHSVNRHVAVGFAIQVTIYIHRKTSATRGKSPRNTIDTGRPDAKLSKYAKAWAFSSIKSANLFRYFARCKPVALLHSPALKALLAAGTALSTSASLPPTSSCMGSAFLGLYNVQDLPWPMWYWSLYQSLNAYTQLVQWCWPRCQ